MIGRFVEQQDVGTTHQCPCQVQSHTPATGELTYRFGNLVRGKSKAVYQLRRTGFGGEAVNRFHGLVKGMQVGTISDRAGFPGRDGRLGLAQFGISVNDVVERGFFRVGAFLRDVGDHIVGINA